MHFLLPLKKSKPVCSFCILWLGNARGSMGCPLSLLGGVDSGSSGGKLPPCAAATAQGWLRGTAGFWGSGCEGLRARSGYPNTLLTWECLLCLQEADMVHIVYLLTFGSSPSQCQLRGVMPVAAQALSVPLPPLQWCVTPPLAGRVPVCGQPGATAWLVTPWGKSTLRAPGGKQPAGPSWGWCCSRRSISWA